MGHLLGGAPFVSSAPSKNGHHARPAVTVHYAQTIDGRIAARNGDAHWVSGESSLQLAHELRASHDAVLVGIGTVITDDPRLTVRLVEGPSPIRVIVDSTASRPARRERARRSEHAHDHRDDADGLPGASARDQGGGR
jgi:riboflavin biosynthesis pyrimidine reductase